MTRYIATFILSISALHLCGQVAKYSIHGKIAEVTTQDPIEFAEILLIHLPDSSPVQNTVTDHEGAFQFTELRPGNYFIEARLTGFEKKQTDSFLLKNESALNLGVIPLNAIDFTLDQIEVLANQPAYVNATDRKIYYTGQDIQSQSGSIADVLQNIPSVTVEAEGEILLRGSANITFLLNGKTSGLLKNNPSLVLDQIPAHTIERIEILTNPSAKYRPDGTAGIINIITKKNVIPGFNGSILANASTNRRYNGNISLNYNPGKFNISILSGYWQNYLPRTFTDVRMYKDSLSGADVVFDLYNNVTGKSRSYTSTLNMDYSPDEMNSLGISGSFWKFNSDRNNDVTTLETIDSGILNDFTSLRMNNDNETEFEINTNAEHDFAKEDHTISMELAYTNFDELEDSRFIDTYRIPVYPPYNGHNKLSKKGNGTTLDIAYTNPFKEDYELEAGYEGEYSNGELDFFSEYFDQDAVAWKNDPAKTNRFLYQQDIHAAYATLSRTFEEFGILAGLRAEQTNITSRLIDLDSIIPNDYFNLFPTLHLSYESGDKHEITLSYSRRVNRPDPDELNPFPEYIDIRDIEAGNPNLKPEQIHSIEFGYHFQNDKISFLPTLYYRNTYDAITEEVHYINDSTLLTTLQNLDTETSGGLDLVFSWTPSKMFTLNLSNNLFYHEIDASNLGYGDHKSIIAADTKSAVFLNLFSSTRLQLNATYRSSKLTSQGRTLPFYFLNAGLKQDIFSKKASITLTVSDIFNTMKWQYIIDTPLLYQKVTRKRKSQIVYLGFSYRFGISGKKNGEELLFDDKI